MTHPLTGFLAAATAIVLSTAAPAAADTPEPDAFPLTGLALECDGAEITFTSGELIGTTHVHEGRRGGTQLVFTSRLNDAWLTDGSGQVLRAVGTATNSSVNIETADGPPVELGTFVANFTLLGDRGKVGSVHLLLRGTDQGLTAVDRGNCRIAW